MADMDLLEVVTKLRTDVRIVEADNGVERYFAASIADVWWTEQYGASYRIGRGDTAEEALAVLCERVEGGHIYHETGPDAYDTSLGIVDVGHCRSVSQAYLAAAGRLKIMPSRVGLAITC
jgi:hypothetical protein